MSDTITPEERAELRELAQMVTPGPYFADGFDVQDDDDTAVARCNGDINDLQEDTQESFAHFIAAACNMAPRLLNALEDAEAERDTALSRKRVVYLITARPDTVAWQDYIFPYAARIHFLRGRLKFIEPETMAPAKDPAMFPSAIVVFDGPLMHRKTPLLWEVPGVEGEVRE